MSEVNILQRFDTRVKQSRRSTAFSRRAQTISLIGLCPLLGAVIGVVLPVGAAPTVVAKVTVANWPSSVAIDGNDVWVVNNESNNVMKIDTAITPPKVVATVAVGQLPQELAVSDGSVWVTNAYSYPGPSSISRITTGSASVEATINVKAMPWGIWATGNTVWVSNYATNTISFINGNRNSVVETIPVGKEPEGITVLGNDVWVADLSSNSVSEVDQSTQSVVATIPVGTQPGNIAAANGLIWVSNYGSGTVSEIDAASATVVRTIAVGQYPKGIADNGKDVFVADSYSDEGSLTEIDASTGEIIHAPNIGTGDGVAASSNSVWVTTPGAQMVSEVALNSGITAPSAPRNLKGVAAPSNVTLTWTAPISDGGSAISGYGVEYSSDGGATWVTNSPDSFSGPTCHTTVNYLSSATHYLFRIRALNAAGWSPPSTAIALVTSGIASVPGKVATTPSSTDTSTATSNAVTSGATQPTVPTASLAKTNVSRYLLLGAHWRAFRLRARVLTWPQPQHHRHGQTLLRVRTHPRTRKASRTKGKR